jgi:hypothetical protein
MDSSMSRAPLNITGELSSVIKSYTPSFCTCCCARAARARHSARSARKVCMGREAGNLVLLNSTRH